MLAIEKTQEILRRWDPLNIEQGTVVIGDEYDAYAYPILNNARIHKDVDVLAHHMSLYFREMHYFIPSWQRTYNIPFAKEIVSLLS